MSLVVDYKKIASELVEHLNDGDRAILGFGMIPKELAETLERNFVLHLINHNAKLTELPTIEMDELDDYLSVFPLKRDLIEEFNRKIAAALLGECCLFTKKVRYAT